MDNGLAHVATPPHTAPPLNSPLLTAEDAARYLKVAVRTLANHRGLGRGPRYVRVGRRPFYRRADLDAWIESHVFEHTAAERL